MVPGIEINWESGKIGDTGVKDDEADYALSTWSGLAPLATAIGMPVLDHQLTPGASPPPRIAALAERLRRTYSGKGASIASIRTVFFSAALPAELTWCLMIPPGYALGLGCLCNHV